jgi:hypothetical protein
MPKNVNESGIILYNNIKTTERRTKSAAEECAELYTNKRMCLRAKWKQPDGAGCRGKLHNKAARNSAKIPPCRRRESGVIIEETDILK